MILIFQFQLSFDPNLVFFKSCFDRLMKSNLLLFILLLQFTETYYDEMV